MEIKICTQCGKELPATNDYFFKDERGKGGLRAQCKVCRSRYDKQRYKNNHGSILKQQMLYYETNKARILEYRTEYLQSGKGKIVSKRYFQTEKGKRAKRKGNKKYRESEKGRAYQKKYCQSEKGKKAHKKARKKCYEKNKLSRNMSNMIYRSLKGNKANRHWETLVSYTLEELKQYLESLFQPGMTWENHTLDGWHIDHKIPISSFNIISYDCEDFKRCWALENLWPLWAEENLKKGNKLGWAKEKT